MRLKSALAEVVDAYDFVMIDCPPSLGLLTVNGLAAAEVLVPIQCEYYARGPGSAPQERGAGAEEPEPGLELSTIVLVMYDARTKLSDQVVRRSEPAADSDTVVCRQVIPRTVRLSEAPSFGQPITAFDGASAKRSPTGSSHGR